MEDITAFVTPVPAGTAEDSLAAFVVASGEEEGERGPSAREGPGEGGGASGRAYYGDAEPEGATVVVGGAEYSVGGWSAYELERRRCEREYGAPAGEDRHYAGRTYVTGEDVMESLFRGAGVRGGGGPSDPLAEASERYATALERRWGGAGVSGDLHAGASGSAGPANEFTGELVGALALGPDEARELAAETDPEALLGAAEAIRAVAGEAAPAAAFPPIPPLPRRPADAAPESLSRLEAAAAPHAEAVEKCRAALAGALDRATARLEPARFAGDLETTDGLLAEYTQWRLTETLVATLDRFKGIPTHEKRAALERFLMTTANQPPEKGAPAWATIYRRKSSGAEAQLLRELASKLSGSKGADGRSSQRLKALLADLRKEIAAAFAGKGPWSAASVRGEIARAPPRCTAKVAKVGRYRETAAEQALERMIGAGGREATLRALLRYGALGAYSSSWGIPFDAARALYDEFGVRFEGFASPLNSRLMGLEGAAFCSLFPDTDAPFGSIGSFFEAGPAAGSGGAWMVNPPYTEGLLARAAEVVLTRAKADPAYEAYFMCPRWTDAEAYRRLAESPHLVAMQETKRRGEFRSEDSLGRQTTGAPTTFFAIAGEPGSACRRDRMTRALARIFREGARR